MIIKKYPAPPTESVASRYDRDWLHVPDLDTAGEDDLRHDRTLLRQPVERKSRRYVDDDISAVTGGAYTYDPSTDVDDSTEENPDNQALWSENFGQELDPSWRLDSSYDPPGGKPDWSQSDPAFHITRPFPLNDFRIDIELNLPETTGGEEDVFSLQARIHSDNSNSSVISIIGFNGQDYGNITIMNGSALVNVPSGTNVYSIVKQGARTSILTDDVEVAHGESGDLGDDAFVEFRLSSSVGEGSIKSITAYDLSG